MAITRSSGNPFASDSMVKDLYNFTNSNTDLLKLQELYSAGFITYEQMAKYMPKFGIELPPRDIAEVEERKELPRFYLGPD